MKTIGVLTSGGDAPGMNAAVRAVVRTALQYNMRVVGIRRGYQGLVNGDIFEMNLRSVSRIIDKGGTILYTARCDEFMTNQGKEKALKFCRESGIDGLVTIGGDGTFRGARELSLLGIPCVGIPATIDNDIVCSDYSIGFDTAMNTVMDMVDRLRDTAESHNRCSVVEVMGRNSGNLALNAGIAVGATYILVPEVPFDFKKDVIGSIQRSLKTNKEHFIIVVSEAFGNSAWLARMIEEQTGIQSRATVLGHVQRGGSPTVRDRVIASRLGNYAVHLLKNNIGNRVVCVKDDKIVDYDIIDGLNMKKNFDIELYNSALEISI